MFNFGSVMNSMKSFLFLLAVTPILHSTEIIQPTALRPGDTIAFVAPARTPDREKILLAKMRLEQRGFHVSLPADLFRQHGYLAGTDQQRADEIMSAFKDQNVDAIFCATGGFGTTRLLHLLDYEVIRKNPKILTGYSDITGLHLAIHRHTGLITFHAPNVDSGLGALSEFSKHWFWRAINNPTDQANEPYSLSPFDFRLADGNRFDQTAYQENCQLPTPRHFGKHTTAEGRIVGGNLSLVAALMGTPFEIETKGNILFLEDIGEAPYRIDRMLSTLQLAGKLDEMNGAVLGTFTERFDQDRSNEGQSVIQVLASYFGTQSKPVIYGFPFGHHTCNATIPIGVRCRIDTANKSVRLLESPTQPRQAVD